MNYYDELEGNGIKDYVMSFFSSSKSRKTEEILKKYGNYDIISIKIHRSPVESILQKVLNIVSLGNFEKEKKKLNYDQIFHLYMIMELKKDNHKVFYLTEKAPNIEYIEQKDLESKQSKGDSLFIKLTHPVKLSSVIEETKKQMGEHFAKYSNPYNNCQTYIFNMVFAMFKLTVEEMPKSVVDYILQNVEDLVKGDTKNVANFVTSLGHFIGRTLLGKSIYGGKLQPSESLIIYHTNGFI